MRYIGQHIFDYVASFRQNVGIGIDTPTFLLHVKNSDADGGNTYSLVRIENGFGNADFGTLSGYARIRAGGTEVAALSSGASYFYNSGATSLALTGSSATFAGDVTVSGNLTVSGTTTTINTTNLNVEDKNITLNYSTGDSSSTADGAGITIQDAVNSSTDATLLWNTSNNTFNFSHGIRVPDNVKIQAGNGGDFDIFHTGSATTIDNATGNLTIQNSADDSDIVFKSDDGSSGLTTYFKLDGSAEQTVFSKKVKLEDSVELRFGNGNDMRLHHNGSNNSIESYSGNLRLIQNTDDGDIQFLSDDGSGGTTEYFRIDGGTEKVVYSRPIEILDNNYLFFGNNQDLGIHHNGTDTTIKNNTGDFYIKQDAADKDIIFQSDDGSGGLTTYFRLDGSDKSVLFSETLKVPDNKYIGLGNTFNFHLIHNGTNSIITSSTGNLFIDNYADDAFTYFRNDDGSGGIATYFFLDGVNTRTEFLRDVKFPDNVKANFGTSVDLQIYHDGSNSQIKNTNGDLKIEVSADDKDIIFRGDNQSGGVGTYFRLDGSTGYVQFADNRRITIGSSDDANIRHDGTDTYIGNSTGHFYIQQAADDKDLVFQCDDGSGGLATYFFLDGSVGHVTFPDSQKLYLGSGHDAYLEHDGSNTYLVNQTGNLNIRNFADDSDIALQCDDGSGGLADYIRLDGSTKTVDIDVPVEINDQMLLGSKQAYTLPAQGTRMRLLQIADNTLCRIYLESSENSYHQPIVLDIFYRAQFTTSKPQIVRSESYRWHVHSNDIIFTSDQAGTIGADSYIYAEKVTYSTSRIVNIRKIEVFDGTVTVLDGSTTDTNGGTDETVISSFSKITTTGDITVGDDLFIADNGIINVGSSNDFNILHDGSNSYILNATGNLYITNNADDKDIIFRSDDGSGSTTEYFRLDGGTETNIFTKPSTFNNTVVMGSQQLKFADSGKVRLGDSNDLELYHDGSDSQIINATGNLIIRNNADDGDIRFRSDDGSGNITTYITLDGGNTRTLFSKEARFSDGVNLKLGDAGDLVLLHNGTDSKINNYVGDLVITNETNDKDIIFQSDDGSGGVTPYLTLDGSATRVLLSQHMQFIDNKNLKLGDGADFQLYHTGTGSVIQNATGNLTIQQDHNDGDIIFRSDDGSGGTTIYFRVDGSISHTSFLKPTLHNDNVKASFGDAPDLHIYHDGTNSYIQNETGQLYILNKADNKDIEFQSDDGNGGLATYFKLDGSLAAHDGSSSTALYTAFPDNSLAAFGDSQDLVMYHSGSHSLIRHLGTGNLYIDNTTDDAKIFFRNDDGSGGLTTYIEIQGDNTRTVFRKDLNLQDTVNLYLGTSSDLRLIHDGADSAISNATGNLVITNEADDGDIIFKSDNGSGGLATYMSIDGGGTDVNFFKDSHHLDSVDAKFGSDSSGDLRIQHNGTDSYIQNFTGNLNIVQHLDDGRINFQSDDGSGGVTTYFKLDGSVGYTTVQKNMRFADNVEVEVGTSGDFYLIHDGTTSKIINDTGDIHIQNNTDDGDIIFRSDDGSGGTTEYFRVDGGGELTFFTKPIQMTDNAKIFFGVAGDLELYHDGTDSYVKNDTGDLYIQNTADDKDIIFQSDNGSGGVIEYLRLDGSHPRLTVNAPNGIVFFDNIKANFGTDSDLQIYHDGSDSFIDDAGTGKLRIRSNLLHLEKYTGENMAIFNADGAVSLYYDGSKKIETSSDGVEIAGNLTVSTPSTSSGIYAQFINLKGFCTLAANYQFAEDLEDTKSPFEMALDYGSATISSSTEVNQSNLFRAAAFHVPVACSVNAINMQLTCNNAGNVTIAVVEYRPSEDGTDQVDHPRTVYEEVVVASNDNNNKVKTVTVATADLDNTAIPAGSHIMIMAKGDDQSTGGKAFISAAIEIKW